MNKEKICKKKRTWKSFVKIVNCKYCLLGDGSYNGGCKNLDELTIQLSKKNTGSVENSYFKEMCVRI
jgi:hypothetical protein